MPLHCWQQTAASRSSVSIVTRWPWPPPALDSLHTAIGSRSATLASTVSLQRCSRSAPNGLSGALFDLGVSSPQLDLADRGFSFRNDGPLDMRMDRSQGRTAADLVNTTDERTLAGILQRNGDERHARRIARAIIAARPISTTGELAEIVRDAVPAAARRHAGHPARKTFQAIRIEINDELSMLEGALTQALDLLAPQGRCAVLSYHSGEDRIVKHVFRDAAGEAPRPRPDLPPPPGHEASVSLLWRGARRPSDAEVERNPRAEAARFRAVEKLGAVA